MKRKRILILSLLIVLVLTGITVMLDYMKSVQEYQAKAAAIVIKDIDIGDVPDGVYRGEYDIRFAPPA